ncbi:MAG: beta-glycosidase [Tannerellaceae bacterium]|jgi:glucosylceramidase|nr:beta-glycosidase [Tannerellaceae bacterium]
MSHYTLVSGALLALFLGLVVGGGSCAGGDEGAEFVSSGADGLWVDGGSVVPSAGGDGRGDVIVCSSDTLQVIEGFGACFNELGWTSLSALSGEDREGVIRELFAPGAGANFTLCRMPVAANDFARNWYSYDEKDGDFAMDSFSIENDRETLIPFIKSALRYMPGLRLWASPWSPPAWMKVNGKYNSPQDAEGSDMFIREEAYLKAYALYFSRFIDAYRSEGIDVFAVMPQNEFNSAQIFPSCCWTAAGLADFVGNYLGPAMNDMGVEVMFGTMERPNESLVDTILAHPAARRHVTGAGFQWAGKDAVGGIHERYPGLKLYQTEQECGDGNNDMAGAIRSWKLMKHYLKSGVSGYLYWNISLMEGGVSNWGWAQNSLVVVSGDGSFRYTPEYYVIKHVSRFVANGARLLRTSGDFDDILAFVNTDGSIVVVMGNEGGERRDVKVNVNGKIYSTSLAAGSLSTLIVRQNI